MPRICASTITSSAVVGSSAISRLGSSTSASAIMIRWRIPPENSCGYCLKRVGGIPILAERLERALAHLVLVELGLVRAQRLEEVALDRVQRVEPGHRLLEDQPELRAAQLAQLVGVEADEVAARVAAPRRRRRALGQQAEDRRARASTCRSPTRRRGRAVSPRVDLEARRRRPRAPGRRRVPYQTRRSRTSRTGACSLTVHLVARSPPWRPAASAGRRRQLDGSSSGISGGVDRPLADQRVERCR